MKKAILAFLILAAIMLVSCAPQRHCRPEFMAGYGDKPSDYK